MRTYPLAFFFVSLLIFVPYQIGYAYLSYVQSIPSFGVVSYPSDKILRIDFEDPSHFSYGKDTIWDQPTGLEYPENKFVPSTETVVSSSTSAKLELTNPYSDGTRRIHVEHKWDPLADRHIWSSFWVYLPSDFKVDAWTNLWKAIEERLGSRTHPWTARWGYNWFQIGLSINDGTKVSETEYRVEVKINHGWVDANNDSINDLSKEYTVYSQDTIKLGEWCKIKLYVYRDLGQGIVQMWINDVLQFDLRGIRTIGIAPETLMNPPSDDGGQFRSWLCTGMSLYSGGSDDWRNVSPKKAFFDNIVLVSGVDGSGI